MSSKLMTVINSSIVKKMIMGMTGLLLCGFLLSHLTGNFLIMVSPEAFNLYAHTLISNPLIYVAEAILATIFLVHIFMGIRLNIENKLARPQSYFVSKVSGRGATFASRTMPYTGLVILVFLVLHLLHFKFGEVYTITYDGVQMRDLHRLVLEYFQTPLNVLYYIVVMICTGIHVSHGFWSAFQSVGFNHPKYNCLIKKVALLYALGIAGGFSVLPIYCFLQAR